MTPKDVDIERTTKELSNAFEQFTICARATGHNLVTLLRMCDAVYNAENYAKFTPPVMERR